METLRITAKAREEKLAAEMEGLKKENSRLIEKYEAAREFEARKPDEPPPPLTDEEDEMKKFEPFVYINEENVKRLAYLFILRKEEPWVVAVVASYLRSDTLTIKIPKTKNFSACSTSLRKTPMSLKSLAA